MFEDEPWVAARGQVNGYTFEIIDETDGLFRVDVSIDGASRSIVCQSFGQALRELAREIGEG
jgi:hypothetical protein